MRWGLQPHLLFHPPLHAMADGALATTFLLLGNLLPHQFTDLSVAFVSCSCLAFST